MRLHLDVLGWLHVIWGAFGVLTGLALLVLAGGAASAFADPGPASGSAVIWTFLVVGAFAGAAGAAMWLAGRGVLRRSRGARTMTLALAIVNLIAVPFGTALGIYAFWALLNDDARREFGRPTRTPPDARSLEQT